MSDAYVIEVQGIAAGIIVRKHQNEESYKFLSALHTFNSLEGQEFPGRSRPNAQPASSSAKPPAR
jgi:hypothetical protein